MSTGAKGHAAQAAGGWARLTLVEQMAHVGSEVDRAIRAHRNGRIERRDHAVTRALELFDLVGADARWRGPRRREMRRAREEFCRLFFQNEPDLRTADGLQKYFLYFAVAARQASAVRQTASGPGDPP